EIFEHGEARKNLAALRHQCEAAPRALVRLERRNVSALPHDLAGADRLQPNHRAHEAGLADAVPAEHAGDAARLGGDADITQDVAGAVIELDVLHREHGSAPEIDVDDALVILHAIDAPVGKHRAVVQ